MRIKLDDITAIMRHQKSTNQALFNNNNSNKSKGADVTFVPDIASHFTPTHHFTSSGAALFCFFFFSFYLILAERLPNSPQLEWYHSEVVKKDVWGDFHTCTTYSDSQFTVSGTLC